MIINIIIFTKKQLNCRKSTSFQIYYILISMYKYYSKAISLSKFIK